MNIEHDIICHCSSVSANDIFRAVEKGRGGLESVIEMTGAGSGCSTCLEDCRNCYFAAVIEIEVRKTGQPVLPFWI